MIFNRWQFLIRGLIGSQGVTFTPTEERVINKVLRHLTGCSVGASRLKPVTIPQVWAALDSPTKGLVADCHYATEQDFYDGTRPLRDALGALCEGSLQGMFDKRRYVDCVSSRPTPETTLTTAPLVRVPRSRSRWRDGEPADRRDRLHELLRSWSGR